MALFKQTGSKVCETLHSKLFSAYRDLNKLATKPDNVKKLKTFGISEAAEMIGRSTQTLRRLDENKDIPKPDIVLKQKREDRQYSLELINHLRDYFGTRPSKPTSADPAILCFVNFKGGAGKTTTSVNAAQYFSLKGYKVLLIDTDSQGSATHMFGYIPDETFGDKDTILEILTQEEKDIKKYIKKTYWDGLDLIPANLSLYNAELILPAKIAEQNLKGLNFAFYKQLDEALKAVYSDYDIIIIDSPPSMGMISINSIWSANIMAIGLPPIMVDFASTTQFFRMAGEILERLPQKEYSAIRIFLTKHRQDNRQTSATQMLNLIKRHTGEFFMSNYMLETEAIKTAAANMQTLYEMDKNLTNKKTYKRAVDCANALNEEFHQLIKMHWDNEE